MRKFELISSHCYPYCRLPERSTKNSAGYDFYNPVRVEIPPYKYRR